MFDAWEIATIIAKWMLYVGVFISSGTVFCLLLFEIDRHVKLVLGFSSLAFLMSIITFMLNGAALTGDASGMIDFDVLKLLWSTQNGSTLVYQVLGAFLILVGFLFGKLGLSVSLLGSVISLWSFVVTGHIADKESWLLLSGLFLHLIIAAFWIGILIPLKCLADDPEQLNKAAIIGEKFGEIAKIAVPVLILMGLIMAYALVETISAIITTDYGQVLFIKIIFVAGLLSLAAINKLRFIPNMKRGEQASANYLSKSINFELLALFIIFLITSVLTTQITLHS